MKFMDLPPTERAVLGRAWDSKWRQDHPDRAAYLDDHPPGPAQPCDICGYHAKRGEQRTKRRWDWDDSDVTRSVFVWRCNGCYKQHGTLPKSEVMGIRRSLDLTAQERIRVRQRIEANPPTEDNPDYYIADGHAYRISETDREFLTRMQQHAPDPDPEPEARGGPKLASWFAEDHFGLHDDSG